MSTDTPPLKTRKPSGKPPWPLVLLAGVEKSGKSYSSAAFSASDLIDRTFYIEIGEGAADQYGEIPGARYEIVEHDGTYVGIGRAIRAATMQPRPNGKPHAIIVDSMTELWDLLSDEAQQTANRRKNKGADAEAQITMDLWNTAKKRWRHILDLLRTYDGPVIFTARLEQVAVVENGKPTEAREWKVRAEKNLPFECDVVVKMVAQDDVLLTGVRSLRLQTGPRGRKLPDFSLQKLFDALGISAESVGPRSYTAPTVAQEAPAEAPQQPEAARPSVQGQHIAISNLFREKHGVTTRERKLAGVAHYLHHPVGSTSELTYDDAAELIDTLSKLPPYRAPQPQPEQDPQQYVGQEMVRQHEEASVDLSDASPAAVAEAGRLEGLPGGASAEDVLRDRIESAGDPNAVDRVLAEVGDAVVKRLITNVQRDVLVRAAGQRKDTLKADAGWSHQRLAEKTGAAA